MFNVCKHGSRHWRYGFEKNNKENKYQRLINIQNILNFTYDKINNIF